MFTECLDENTENKTLVASKQHYVGGDTPIGCILGCHFQCLEVVVPTAISEFGVEGGGRVGWRVNVSLQQECLQDAIHLATFWGSHSRYFNGCHSRMAVLRGVTPRLLNSGGVTPVWLC